MWKILVWLAFFGIIVLLRGFFFLIFLTFVFAYIQSRVVDKLSTRIASRRVRVVIAGIGLLLIILGIGSFIIPGVKAQAILFKDKLPIYLQTLERNIVSVTTDYPFLKEILPSADESQAETKHLQATSLIQFILGGSTDMTEPHGGNKQALDRVKDVGGYLLGLTSGFLLSLLFSFLIVLDLPKLSKSVKELSSTKVGFIYDEVADSVHDFCAVLGRAMEAQLFVAILNTILTAIGVIFVLGIEDKVSFISLIVFLCSFIPVAGVFISSVPICLLSLQESGFGQMFLAIGLITVIHMIEAYILNPKIYGHHLRMNPVIVLIILTVAGKMAGVWGLVLGVPICNYIFNNAIRYRALPSADPAELK
jgi:predicted PurR-regulated permease PerM